MPNLGIQNMDCPSSMEMGNHSNQISVSLAWLLMLLGHANGDAMFFGEAGTLIEPNNTEVVAFSSDEGSRLFRAAMRTDYMKSYAKLSDQSATQNVTTTCGVASLTMILNALNLDEETGWRMQNMWYRDADVETIDYCCKARVDILPNAAAPGLSLSQLLYTANCNGLEAGYNYGPDVANGQFHALIKEVTSSPHLEMVVNFYRPDFGQIGSGHFSPIGGYSEATQKVLILDTSRYKYPAYWVPVELLWKAMNGIDSDSKQPRGFIIFWPKGKQGPSNIFFASEYPLWEFACTKQPESRMDALPGCRKRECRYKETLPKSDKVIAFSSKEGQALFIEALGPEKLEGPNNMADYGILSDQAVTQLDLATSGLSSLSMVLNAMSLDPVKGWRIQGKWYKDGTDASVTSCCKSRKHIIAGGKGLSLEELYYTAKCNNLKPRLNFASNFTLDHFRNIVHVVTQSLDMSMIVNFKRQDLGMDTSGHTSPGKGNGHFSPVGGFNRARDMVLILETSRYLYPTFWVPIQLLYTAMTGISTGSLHNRSRGYLVLSRTREPAELVDWTDAKTGKSRRRGWNFAQASQRLEVCCVRDAKHRCVTHGQASRKLHDRKYMSRLNTGHAMESGHESE